MKVYYAEELKAEKIRTHPWTTSLFNSDNKYYDFKQTPDMIPEVLEDFKLWAYYEAIQLFYDLLRWLNGSESLLESNDCAFKGPGENNDKQFSKSLKCSGRLMLLYRDLQLNISEEHINWLKGCFEFHLGRLDTEFEWGAIGLTFCDTEYIGLTVPENERMGKLLQLT